MKLVPWGERRLVSWMMTAAFALSSGAGILVACSSDSKTQPLPIADAAAGGDVSVAPAGSFAVEVPCNDTVDSIYADPGTLPDERGAIIRCAREPDLPKDVMQARLTAAVSHDGPPVHDVGYAGPPLTSDARVYRILFRTERGDDAGTPGYSSGKLFVPTQPRANKLPIIVGARGSRGSAARCAASKEDPSIKGAINDDYAALFYAAVGHGFAVFIPDLAGYANYGGARNPPSGYAAYKDVGKGTLDGARAMKRLMPSSLMDKVALLAHSQGGHSAFSALALAETYAPELDIAGVAAFSPLWLNNRTWGAVFNVRTFPVAPSGVYVAGVDVWYHYTHGEILDGPGHGLDVIAPDVREGVKQWVDTACWGEWDGLYAAAYHDAGVPESDDAGLKYTADLFDPAFVASIKYAAGLGSPCKAGDEVCAKWIARYLDDRPHLTGKAKTVPILLAYGLLDGTIPATRMACILDRLHADDANFKMCVFPDQGHGSQVRTNVVTALDWLAARTLGGPEPTCPGDESAFHTDAGTKFACETPPPND